jgi:hypothetical protein
MGCQGYPSILCEIIEVHAILKFYSTVVEINDITKKRKNTFLDVAVITNAGPHSTA